MLQYLVIVGALVNIFGSWFYIQRTLRGVTKPNRVTYIIWALAPMVAFAASISDGVGWAALPVFISGFIPFLIFLASFVNKNAYWKISRLDYACGTISILALVFWRMTGDPAIAVLLAIVSDALASLPTVIKSWRFPETEYWSGYAGAIVAAITALIAAPSFTFTAVAFPIYLIVVCTLLLLGIFQKQLRLGARA